MTSKLAERPGPTCHEEAISKGAGARKLVCPNGDGLSLYGEGTNGKSVLLIHGVTGSPVEMKYMAKGLHRAGYTVYAPLLAGHGVDTATLRRSQWEEWYQSAREAAQWLASRGDDMFIAGVCVGGLIGLRVAHEMHGRVRAATVYSPLLVYNGWNTPYYYRSAPFLVPIATRLGLARYLAFKERHPFGIKSDRIRRLLQDGIRGTMPSFPVETLYQNHRVFDWIKRTLPAITTPTLLIHSTEDDISSPRNATYISDHIGGPCEIAWLHNSYHMIHVDQEHSEVFERTRAFFDAHGRT